jgi:hypothetical protein
VGRFVDQVDIEHALGPQMTRRLYDDENTGSADSDSIEETILTKEAIVIGAAVRTYPVENLPATPAEARTTVGGRLLQTITLDFIRGYANERHPEVARDDGSEATKRAFVLVKMLSEAKLWLEGIAPAPANSGGAVYAGESEITDTACGTSVWNGSGGTGYF